MLRIERRKQATSIHACFNLTDHATTEGTFKFQEMFLRRLTKGQTFHHPYLGCREFAAHFELITHTTNHFLNLSI